MEEKVIVVWFSCGAASAVALAKTIEKYGRNNEIIALNNPVKEEHEDNQRFLQDVSKFLDVKIDHVISEKYPSQSCVEVWDKRKYMSGIAGAPCTQELKKKARQSWEAKNKFDYIVLGFTFEEKHRHDRFKKFERENILPVLIDEKITKADCYREVESWGIKLPEAYKHGLPNANCIGCVKSTSVTYWNLIRKEFPDVFEQRAKQSREIGCRLVRYKGKRIFLDELDPKAKGNRLVNYDFECGIFCEEKI